MTKRRVILELRATPALWQAASQPFAQAAEALPSLPGIALDTSFAPVHCRRCWERRGGDELSEKTDRLTLALRPEQATYLVRGEIDDEATAVVAAAQPPVHPDVVGIFAVERLVGWLKECRRILTRFENDRPQLRRYDQEGLHPTLSATPLPLTNGVLRQSLVSH